MGRDYPPLSVKVWGDLACFTRPEMKVERVSYDVMTPSAARGILEAIFWRPEFSWQIVEIAVLKPIRRISILRNEVNSPASSKVARTWMDDPLGGYFADEDRTQRHTLALRDVEYVIKANVQPTGRGSQQNPAKYRDQFRRRVSRGQCFHRPYLGCREFAAGFVEPSGDESPIDRSEDLGQMLFDIRYPTSQDERHRPIFFGARLEKGFLSVPQDLYSELTAAQQP